jgi:hypothetical protein
VKCYLIHNSNITLPLRVMSVREILVKVPSLVEGDTCKFYKPYLSMPKRNLFSSVDWLCRQIFSIVNIINRHSIYNIFYRNIL